MTGVSLDKTELELTEGDEAQLKATVAPDDATDKSITWKSSDDKVATVSSDGKVTAVAPGEATITVTTTDGSRTATCKVTVNAKIYPVESVSLDKTTLILIEGDNARLTATISPENATNKNVTWKSSDEAIATVSADGIVTAVAPGTATITVTAEDGGKTAECSVKVLANIDGALPGLFSVSPTKQVRFSKGNLQATWTKHYAYDYYFATNQYDYIGNASGNINIGKRVSGDVADTFGWSTYDNIDGISISTDDSDYSGNFVDWGKNIGDGSTWRTLSKDEWVYLFETRTNASSLYKYGVTVCGKDNCVIIAPDNWDTSANPLQTSYDATAWATAEAAGLVCLPAAGYRSGSHVSDIGDYGGCWSSTASGSYNAYFMYFSSSGVGPDSSDFRLYGSSVRLITDVK